MPLGTALRELPGYLYVHIADVLRRRIEDGEWMPGTKIPSIKFLANDLDVAVVTIRQAVELLEQEGLLKRRQGRGTFVEADATQQHVWLEMNSTWDDLVKRWHGIDPKILRSKDRTTEIPLQTGDGVPVDAYHYMRRLHSFEQVPYALVDLYLDSRIYEREPERFDTQRVVPLIEAQPDITISSAKETLCVDSADMETAALLNVRLHTPVAKIRRVVKDQRGFVIYLLQGIYRGDIVRLERTFVG